MTPFLAILAFCFIVMVYFSDGADVPSGTKPETCLACRGSGFVSSSSCCFCQVASVEQST
jgi:DnaJ-class molecular chaperone